MPGNSTFAALLVRDLKIACRHRAEAILPLIFFVIVASLFPLAVSPDPEVLKKIGPGVIWVAGLLSVLLSLTVRLSKSCLYPCCRACRI